MSASRMGRPVLGEGSVQMRELCVSDVFLLIYRDEPIDVGHHFRCEDISRRVCERYGLDVRDVVPAKFFQLLSVAGADGCERAFAVLAPTCELMVFQ